MRLTVIQSKQAQHGRHPTGSFVRHAQSVVARQEGPGWQQTRGRQAPDLSKNRSGKLSRRSVDRFTCGKAALRIDQREIIAMEAALRPRSGAYVQVRHLAVISVNLLPGL
jgi:hypothetical protein